MLGLSFGWSTGPGPLGAGPLGAGWVGVVSAAEERQIHWLSTRDTCERLGVTLRTLYRFIDEGQLPAYKMGRVIRLQSDDVDGFIERMRIAPGTLEHLYPEPKGHDRAGGGSARGDDGDDSGEDATSLEGSDELVR